MFYSIVASLRPHQILTAVGGHQADKPGNPVDKAALGLFRSGVSRKDVMFYQTIGYHYLHHVPFTLFSLAKHMDLPIAYLRKRLTAFLHMGLIDIDRKKREVTVHCAPDPDNPDRIKGFAQALADLAVN